MLEQKTEPSEGVPTTKWPPTMVTIDKGRRIEGVTKNLTKFMVALPNIKGFRVTPNRISKTQKELRNFAIQVNNWATKKTGDFVHMVRWKETLNVKKHINRSPMQEIFWIIAHQYRCSDKKKTECNEFRPDQSIQPKRDLIETTELTSRN